MTLEEAKQIAINIAHNCLVDSDADRAARNFEALRTIIFASDTLAAIRAHVEAMPNYDIRSDAPFSVAAVDAAAKMSTWVSRLRELTGAKP